MQHEYFQVSLPVEIKPEPNFALESNHQQNRIQSESQEPKKQEKKIEKQEPKSAIYYLQKARYKPGVNISEMLSKQL